MSREGLYRCAWLADESKLITTSNQTEPSAKTLVYYECWDDGKAHVFLLCGLCYYTCVA